ncbi:hypothetical protein EG68_11492 [Paragonimus skrjabini miyazakii]|uniref:Bardet-Biedl syndrome 1 N-terminal domain-containing protein n=1 Tax=Paragonimus skrjabini miyazakii TaxID=59628 RepID=A0A8S9YJJ3_9TREM|nr:hypothetical protein EG68_11492 [Paragonimus skrjabini miyazakii]
MYHVYLALHSPFVSKDLAVASGPNLYVYRNLKPYFKFKLPLLELCAEEEDAWRRAEKGDICPDELFKELENLHRNSAQLTVRSLKFLKLKPTESYAFFETYRTVPLKRQTTATCMTKMYRHQSSPDAVQCLVVGTEDGALYIIDPITFNALTKVSW